MARDVFISHSAQDKKVAETICGALEDSGIRCWVAPRDVRHSFPGDDGDGIPRIVSMKQKTLRKDKGTMQKR